MKKEFKVDQEQGPRAPVSEKGVTKPFEIEEWADSYTDFYSNTLVVAKALQDELRGKNLEWKYINANQFRANQGHHKAHWKPYNYKSGSPVTEIQGVDVEGFIRRGDLILGVRPVELGNKHRAHLKAKNDLLDNITKSQADQLKESAKERGVNIKVEEGYED